MTYTQPECSMLYVNTKAWPRFAKTGCGVWSVTASRLGFRQPEIAQFRSRRAAAFEQFKGAPIALVARTQGPGRWNRRGAFVLQKRGRA